MSVHVQVIHTKLAWLRDPSVPQGETALGHFVCPCGGIIGGDYCLPFGSPHTFDCAVCGLAVDGHGWIVRHGHAPGMRGGDDR